MSFLRQEININYMSVFYHYYYYYYTQKQKQKKKKFYIMLMQIANTNEFGKVRNSRDIGREFP